MHRLVIVFVSLFVLGKAADAGNDNEIPLSTASSNSKAGHEKPFDVAKGDITTIASGSISQGDTVDCSVDVVSWNNEEEFSRGLSIWFSTTSDISAATKDDHAVRLSAEYAEKMGGLNHWFSVFGIGLNGTLLHVYAAKNNPSFRMRLTWSEDGAVFYSVHPGGGTASVFKADTFSPEYWLVTAESVTGTLTCTKKDMPT